MRALNDRGLMLITYLKMHLPNSNIQITEDGSNHIQGYIEKKEFSVTEEDNRTKQPSIFDLLRQLTYLFFTDDPFLDIYGSFGFDLIFELEDIEYKKQRSSEQEDIHLYLPDELMVVDHELKRAYRLS